MLQLKENLWWSDRYVVLEHGLLVIYRKKSDEEAVAEVSTGRPVQSMELMASASVQFRDEAGYDTMTLSARKGSHVFTVANAASDTSYRFRASTVAEQMSWWDSIGSLASMRPPSQRSRRGVTGASTKQGVLGKRGGLLKSWACGPPARSRRCCEAGPEEAAVEPQAKGSAEMKPLPLPPSLPPSLPLLPLALPASPPLTSTHRPTATSSSTATCWRTTASDLAKARCRERRSCCST